jgi:2-oxoglutarate dehydrogenase E1 component
MSSNPGNGSSAAASASSIYAAYNGNTYLFGGNAPYVEEMYENYLANPGSVPDSWRDYFDALQHVPAVDGSNAKDVPHLPVINAFAERAKQGQTRVVVASGADSEMGRKRTAVQQLIAAYRNVGARWADLDPLKRTERDKIPELELSHRCRPGNGVQHQQHLLRQRHHEFARADERAARNLLRHHRC